MGDYRSAAVLLVVASAILLVSYVECLSDGAPSQACGTIAPIVVGHANAEPQATPVPYSLDLSSLLDENGDISYVPDETYTLSFNGSNTFRGIFLQGRLMADDTTAVGTFDVTIDPLTELSACTPPEISITHTSNVDKDSITTEWTAPPEGTGPLRIGFAVVQIQIIYWANERSPLIAERQVAATIESPTDGPATTDNPVTTEGNNGFGGDPHFSIILPSTKQQLCYSVQGEDGFIFNLVSNEVMQMNALFVADSERNEVTWIGSLGLVLKKAPYKTSDTTTISFNAMEKTIQVGTDVFLKAEKIDQLTFANGKLIISEANRGFNCSCFPIKVNLQDIGLNFTVHFVKNNHIDMKWERVEDQPRDSHGIIGQFFRNGVDIDETRRVLQLPGMEPVPVIRKPIWHFMERDTPEEKLCWVAMNPGYQGKRLIEGSYLDYVVDDLLSEDFKH